MPQPRSRARSLTLGLVSSLVMWLVGAVLVQPPPLAHAAELPPYRPTRMDPVQPALEIEEIRFEGKTRTRERLALQVAGVAVGDSTSAASLQTAGTRLADSPLFHSCTLRILPGSRRGLVIVVFEVEESRPHLRFGVGYEELGGWFLEPAQLRMDNLTGRGEEFALAFRLGWRNAGLHLDWTHRSFREPMRYWGFGLHSETQSRLYFADGAEIAHPVARGSVEITAGVPLYSKLGLRLSARTETVRPDSSAKLNVEASDGRGAGTFVPTEELPNEIQGALGERKRTWLGASVVLDRRRGSGLARTGLWGDAGYEVALSRDDRTIHHAHLDARGYLPRARWQLASRVAVESVSEAAPFYDRPYLGGLYAVRGYPSHALSPAGGDLVRATGSIEIRTPLYGAGPHPRVVGLAFLDVGVSSDHSGESTTAVGVGYGWRVRIPWLGHLGFDVGIPLSDSPVDEAFHGNVSLGWTY